jgi:hypothetical protein
MIEAQTDRDVRREAADVLDRLRTRVYAQPLTLDGRHFRGEARQVLENDQAWEAHVIEGHVACNRSSGITAKPAIRYHFKTGQTELIQNKSSYTSQTFVVQIFCS